MPVREWPFAPGDSVHVVGVAGVGMSAIAQLLIDHGCRVTGSDRFYDQGESVPVLSRLAAAGISLRPQDGSAVESATRAVITSTAIEEDNPDRLAAVEAGVPIIHRAECLAGFCSGKQLIAVAGTAGKTTVTGLVGWILASLGRDPTVVNGGAVLNWRTPDRVGNVRKGESDLVVAEVDESDRSLLHFSPDVAAITNVSQDHFPLAEVVQLFQVFAGRVRGPVWAGAGVPEQLDRPALHKVRCEVKQTGGEWVFDLEGIPVRVPMPGRHNAENATMAASVCRTLGCEAAGIAEAIGTFAGIERRLQRVGCREGISVVDDYAHNPVKITAAWKAVSQPGKRVIGIWRPHGFAPLSLMFDEFVDAFVRACGEDDRVFLLPVFYAGGTASGERTSADLADALRTRGMAADEVEDYPSLSRAVREIMRAGDTLLVMGARDPGLPRWAEQFLA